MLISNFYAPQKKRMVGICYDPAKKRYFVRLISAWAKPAETPAELRDRRFTSVGKAVAAARRWDNQSNTGIVN